MPNTLEEQIRGRCKHFNGVMNDTCRAGVRYDAVGRGAGYQQLPCLRGVGNLVEMPADQCPKREWPTEEDVVEEIRQSNEAIERFLTLLAEGKCPHCGEPVIQRRQVGRCVYAEPCGHRMYQGKA